MAFFPPLVLIQSTPFFSGSTYVYDYFFNEAFFLLVTAAMVTEKVFFYFFMTTNFRETSSFISAVDQSKPLNLWKIEKLESNRSTQTLTMMSKCSKKYFLGFLQPLFIWLSKYVLFNMSVFFNGQLGHFVLRTFLKKPY